MDCTSGDMLFKDMYEFHIKLQTFVSFASYKIIARLWIIVK